MYSHNRVPETDHKIMHFSRKRIMRHRETGMDKKYFTQNLLTGFLFLLIAIVVFYLADAQFYKDVYLVTFMLLSTLLYPLSRYVISAAACKLRPKEFWRKLFPKNDISGTDALFIFACAVLAIPLGGLYLTCMIVKKGRKSHPSQH
jgi:O-antigen/teichoic acid export membrane protein